MLADFFFSIAIFAAPPNQSNCQQVAVQKPDGTLQITTMCQGKDGKWRPAPANYASPAPTPVAAPRTHTPCKPRRSRFGKLLGGLGEGIISGGMNRAGVRLDPAWRATMRGVLTDSFSCVLDESEQHKAVDASNRAVKGKIGQPVAWTSDTRPGVSGSSTPVGENRLADGTVCRTVNDVAIVDGEETTVQKNLCRAPGATGYTLALQRG